MDGYVFESSADNFDRPWEFELGKGEVIKGWDEGVASMKLNETAEFIISPDYKHLI